MSPVPGSLLIFLLTAPALFAQTAAPARSVLVRNYQLGERLVYRMSAVNEGRRYQALATAEVRKNERGVFVEEFAWTNLVWNGEPVTLDAASSAYREVLSLDPRSLPGPPQLKGVDTRLVGPITDLLTLYADLIVASRIGNLRKPGDHFLFKYPAPNSWADGKYVVLGEDSINFDLNLESVDAEHGRAVVLVRHVPPAQPSIRLPAEWMKEPVADTANNWVEVARRNDGYVAAIGKETFDVRMTVSLPDGRILKATIDNPVITRERDCRDAALTDCSAPRPHSILRQIEVELVP